jgi:hypothetical protein
MSQLHQNLRGRVLNRCAAVLPQGALMRKIAAPQTMRRINGAFTVFWVFMVPISYFAGWLDSVIYVSALSLWALVSGHWSAWQAARVETRQELDADVAEVLEALRKIERRFDLQAHQMDLEPINREDAVLDPERETVAQV